MAVLSAHARSCMHRPFTSPSPNQRTTPTSRYDWLRLTAPRWHGVCAGIGTCAGFPLLRVTACPAAAALVSLCAHAVVGSFFPSDTRTSASESATSLLASKSCGPSFVKSGSRHRESANKLRRIQEHLSTLHVPIHRALHPATRTQLDNTHVYYQHTPHSTYSHP